ncbi:unnamed protein product, partial [Rotaria sp. Silwood1]
MAKATSLSSVSNWTIAQYQPVASNID